MLTVGPLSVAVSDITVGTIPGRYFVSTSLSLNCSINVLEAVDVDYFTITEFWSSPGGPISSDNTNDRYIIAPAAMQAGDSSTYMYVSTLRIDSLDSTGSDSDSGTYSCNMTLTLTGDHPNIQPPAASGVDQFELTVEGNALSYNMDNIL